MSPAECVQPRDIEQFAGRSIRLRGIEPQFGFRVNDGADLLRQFTDGDFFSRADVDRFGIVVAFQEKQAGIGQVIDVQELPTR